MRARFIKRSLLISAFTIFAFLLSFHSSLLSIEGASSPQDPDARPSTQKTTQAKKKKKTQLAKRKTTPANETGPTSASTDFSGMTIVLNPTNAFGTISGKIAWTGPARRIRLDTSVDPLCSQISPELLAEDTVVEAGKLANVFVYIKDGTTVNGEKLGDLHFDVPNSDVFLDQRGCRFVPHVLGIQVNQKLKITNRDPTDHNIHFTPRNNPDWNHMVQSGATHIEHTFAHAEVMLPAKDNQHPWMKAYIGVLPHPFFAVTNLEGSFEIRNVPQGTYTLVAWHEGGVNGSENTVAVSVKPVRIAQPHARP